MREISCDRIRAAVKEMCMEANYRIDQNAMALIRRYRQCERSVLGQQVLGQLLENADVAAAQDMPACQDTGMAIFFVELGQDVHITGGWLEAAVNQGVREGYQEGWLRKSVVSDPINRNNTGDNTPAIIHYRIVAGESFKISFMPKGFGSENMSRLFMLTPSQGIAEARKKIVETVVSAGANACPPVVVGVCIGGDFEQSALLAKRSLLRPLGIASENPQAAALEQELLRMINDTGVGPQGFGGDTTALAVHVELAATHIAGLPVAVNLCCHAFRHAERSL